MNERLWNDVDGVFFYNRIIFFCSLRWEISLKNQVINLFFSHYSPKSIHNHHHLTLKCTLMDDAPLNKCRFLWAQLHLFYSRWQQWLSWDKSMHRISIQLFTLFNYLGLLSPNRNKPGEIATIFFHFYVLSIVCLHFTGRPDLLTFSVRQ